MSDLKFDPIKRDLVIENGNLVLEANPSVQNGLIIRDAKCINVYSPILGIGFNPINSHKDQVVKDMNRWKKQVIQDGARVANFTMTSTGLPTSDIDISIEVSYVQS